MKAQDLSQYKWKNRMVLLLTTTKENIHLSRQMKNFEAQEKELSERKLKVFQVTPESFREVFPIRLAWEKGTFYKQFRKSDSDFEVLLLGLDGNIKIRQEKILDSEDLFRIIDAMPMRQAEMKKNQ